MAHDPQIITDAEGNYIRTVCRDCGARLDTLDEPGPIEASAGAHAAAAEVSVVDEPAVIEGLLPGSIPHNDDGDAPDVEVAFAEYLVAQDAGGHA